MKVIVEEQIEITEEEYRFIEAFRLAEEDIKAAVKVLLCHDQKDDGS